jgi:hypothetical protein
MADAVSSRLTTLLGWVSVGLIIACVVALALSW